MKCGQNKSRSAKKENRGDESIVEARDDNRDPIFNSLWGTPLLRNGDGKSFVSTGKEMREIPSLSDLVEAGMILCPPSLFPCIPVYSPSTLGLVQPTNTNTPSAGPNP